MQLNSSIEDTTVCRRRNRASCRRRARMLTWRQILTSSTRQLQLIQQTTSETISASINTFIRIIQFLSKGRIRRSKASRISTSIFPNAGTYLPFQPLPPAKQRSARAARELLLHVFVAALVERADKITTM